MKKRDASSIELEEYFEALAQAERDNSAMRFGEFVSTRVLPNGYRVRVTIRAPKKGAS